MYALLLSAAVGGLGIFLVVLIVDQRFDDELWCSRITVDTEDAMRQSTLCSLQMDTEFQRIGVHLFVNWIYWPLLLLFDLAAASIATVSLASSYLNRTKTRRFRLVLVSATSLILTVSLAIPQIIMSDTVSLISSVVD